LPPSRHWQQPCCWPAHGSECSNKVASVGARVRVSPRGTDGSTFTHPLHMPPIRAEGTTLRGCNRTLIQF
jgi:hypothetical protein